MANVRQDEDIAKIRREQASWLVDRIAEAAGIDDLRNGERGARADLARFIIQANNGDTEEKTFVDKTIDLIARWGQLRSSKNFGGGSVEIDTLLLFGNAWKAIARGAWSELPSHKVEQWVNDCLSGARDWYTGEEKGLVGAEAELLELKRSIDTTLPALRAALEQCEQLRVSLITQLGQNTEKGSEIHPTPENTSSTRIPTMPRNKNVAEFARAMRAAIDAAGEAGQIREQCCGRRTILKARYDAVLRGEDIGLTPTEVQNLYSCIGERWWQDVEGRSYTVEDLKALAGCGNCNSTVH